MKTKILSFVALAAAIGLISMGIQRFGTTTAPVAAHPSVKREPGVVRFAAGAPQLSSLKVEAVHSVAMPVSEQTNGRITYDENVTARITSPILGRVVGMHAEIGDHVTRQQVLLDIDSPDLATAEADWRKAGADEFRKKLAFERGRGLFEHEVIARKDYESAEADYRQAVAETKRASLRMKNLNASGNENGRFALKSPIAGVIADRQANPGLEVRPDLPNPLFVVSDLSRLWLIVDVPERNIASIKPGQAVRLDTDAYPSEIFNAKVDRIGLVLDPGTRRIQVRCILPNPEYKLRPEMFAHVAFLADGDRLGVQMPNNGMIVEGLYTYVFVEKMEGVFEKRRVNVATRDREHSFITTGLANGDRVVTEGTLLLNSEVSSNAQ